MSDQFENDGPYQDAVSAEEIERRIMDSTFPKTSMEWWARHEIESLRARIAELEAALKPFDERLKVLETVPNAAKYATSTDIDIVHLRNARVALNGEKDV